LKDKLQTIGCELCTEAELKEVGLKSCTNLFETSYAMAASSGKRFPMSDAVKQFSFLNRWFIFRRKGEMGIAPLVAPLVTQPVSEEQDEIIQPVASLVAPPVASVVAPLVAPPVAPVNGKRAYAAAEVLQFYQEATLQDRLKIGNKTALRWIAPGSPFPIQDPTDSTQVYPSIEHYLAGMRYKYATDKPTLASAIFGKDSPIIHQKYENMRRAEMGPAMNPLSEDRAAALIVEEMKAVHTEMKATAMKKYKAKFDEVKWNSIKDDLLEEAVRQRWEKDAQFRTIVEAAKQQGKTLLFYTGSGTSEYGGKRTAEGVIEGENKLGKAIMKVAGFA